MGPGHCAVRRRGRTRAIPALGPSRRALAIRVAAVEHAGYAPRNRHVSGRRGPAARATPDGPAERLGPCFGRGQRSGHALVVGDAPDDVTDRNAGERPGGAEQARWRLVSNSPERRARRLAERALYDDLSNQPGLDRLAEDLAPRWLPVPVRGIGEGGGALQERAADAALRREWGQ